MKYKFILFSPWLLKSPGNQSHTTFKLHQGEDMKLILKVLVVRVTLWAQKP